MLLDEIGDVVDGSVKVLDELQERLKPAHRRQGTTGDSSLSSRLESRVRSTLGPATR